MVSVPQLSVTISWMVAIPVLENSTFGGLAPVKLAGVALGEKVHSNVGVPVVVVLLVMATGSPLQ